MAEVICVGSAVFDHIYDVDELPADSETVFAHSYRRAGAGGAANAAVAASKLDAKTVLWARLGNDETGDLIVSDLQRYRVDTSAIRRIDGAQSPISSVLSASDGGRQTTRFHGVGLTDETDWLPLDRLQDTSIVLADPGWLAGAQAVLSSASEHRVPSVLTIDVTENDIPVDMLSDAKYIVLSPTGLARLTGSNDCEQGLHQIRNSSAAIAGVCSGVDGFSWLDPDGNFRTAPRSEADIVDPTGAWDAFCGAFTLALGERKDLELAIRFANTVAALTAAQPGGRRAFPDRHTAWLTLEAAYGSVEEHFA